MSNVTVIQDKFRVVRPSGEIDYNNVGDFDDALNAAVREHPKGFIIDLSDVTYFDSSGMRAILYAYQRIHNAGGKLALVVNTKNVHALIEALNLEKAPGMDIRESVEAAEEALL